uniref:Uncharacterized protein n=1 Tax=Oryza punctata TaxID=4537 RepID=A0A0E0KXI8_ORYPU
MYSAANANGAVISHPSIYDPQCQCFLKGKAKNEDMLRLERLLTANRKDPKGDTKSSRESQLLRLSSPAQH